MENPELSDFVSLADSDHSAREANIMRPPKTFGGAQFYASQYLTFISLFAGSKSI